MSNSAQRRHSTLASWAGTILRALDAHGHDGTALGLRVGIEPEALRTPGARIPRDALTRLWGEAVAATGDPCFGLVAARYALPTSFHALGYAVLASESLREALERIIRYRRLIGDVVRLELQDHSDRGRFIIDVDAAPGAVPFEAVDAFALTVARQARLVRGEPRSGPLAVSLRRPEPAGSERFRDSFRAPVAFAQPANFLDFARADLDAALPTGNAELARQNDEAVVRYLARLEQSGVAMRVQHALLEELPNGAPSKIAVARRLGMSARTLQRHLDGEKTSFKELLNAARLALARDYLDTGHLPLTEIAFMLGFADSSAFSRAFKRWTGTAPREARFVRRGEGRGAGGGRPSIEHRDRSRRGPHRSLG